MHRTPSRGPAALAIALLAATAGLPAQSARPVSPADRAGLEGSTSTIYPLGRFDCRYQQLFDDLGSARVLRGHAYRRDALGNRGTIQGFRTSLTVRLASAASAAVAASATFASNLRGTPTTVLPRTQVSFPTTARPTTVPGGFALVVPYRATYLWSGTGSLCLDLVIDGNQLATGPNQNFAAALDAHQLFHSGRNLQPGYPYGAGCPAPGNSRPARAGFEIRHLGQRLELAIDARDGVPTTGTTAGRSVLLLGGQRHSIPWPGRPACSLLHDASVVLPLPGANTATGAWSQALAAGAPPPAGFELFAQVLSHGAGGALALSDGSRLIAPPAGRGVVSSRVVAASDRTAASGAVSFTVPVTEFH